MERRSTELWLALVAIIIITLVYLLVMNITGSTPGASGLFGHSLGIIGFTLMIMTELLYSLRKRSRKAYWGRTSFWLRLITSMMFVLCSNLSENPDGR